MTSQPRAFVSHTGADKVIAEQLSAALRARGIDAWFDSWEIAPGDSLVDKIFSEGLRHCQLFIVLLSPESIVSKWVQHELDTALVRRLEKDTRVVPVLVRTCEIPEALRALRRLDATTGVESIVSELADIALGRWPDRKPPVLMPTGPERSLVAGYSDHAWSIVMQLRPLLLEGGLSCWYGVDTFAEHLQITPEQFEDALNELDVDGAIRFSGHFGSENPFDIGTLQPTSRLALRLHDAGQLDFDPRADFKKVMVATAASGCIDPETLLSETGLSIVRLNIAVALVDAEQGARVSRCLGDEYDFAQIDATSATRQWVREHAK